jgi:hypothetical protein
MSEEDKTVADDMFADIVIDTINVTELDAIILKAKEDASKPSTTTPVKTNSLANELLVRVSKLYKFGDIFAGISKKVMKEVQPAEDRSSKPSKDAPSTSSSNSVDRAEFTKEISNNLKNGPGIMMKIASRWAEADVVNSSPKKTEKEGEKDSAVKSFESEQSSLLKEMAEVKKYNRLRRFTEAVDEVRVTKAPILHTASNIVYDDNKVLKNVGAADKTAKEVLANTTIANNEENYVKDKNVVYMASAPGFVPSGRKPQTVVNVNKNKTREKLRKLNLYQAFPSEAVVSAYLSPAVDTSEERFSWAVTNLVGVRDFAIDRFGWDKSQVGKLLKPVIRALEERGGSRQVRLEKYFKSHRVKLPDKGLLISTSKK